MSTTTAPQCNASEEEEKVLPKIRFAPLNIPMERRMQTLTVAIWSYLQIFCIVISILLLLIFPFTIPMLMYLAWIYIDKAPSKVTRPWSAFKRANWWKHFAAFFPANLHKTADLDPKKSYIFGLNYMTIIVLPFFYLLFRFSSTRNHRSECFCYICCQWNRI